MATKESALAMASVLYAISRERARQEQLKGEGRFAHTCADPELTNSERFVILSRELGEVARAVAVASDRRPELAEAARELRTELVQVAAVAVAWLEALSCGS